jgi:hypothetical protein
MVPVISLAVKRLIRKRLSRAVGAQVELVSLQAAIGVGNFNGFLTANGKLARFCFTAGGERLQLLPQYQLFRWDRSVA